MNADKTLEQLKLREQQFKTRKAELELVEQEYRLAPHCNVPVTVFRDGSRWVCMFESHHDPMKCVVAYGDSPKQACSNFDHLWVGAPGYLIDQEDEEEEF